MPELLSKFQPNWTFVQMKGHALFQGEIIMTFEQSAFKLIAFLKFVYYEEMFLMWAIRPRCLLFMLWKLMQNKYSILNFQVYRGYSTVWRWIWNSVHERDRIFFYFTSANPVSIICRWNKIMIEPVSIHPA